jgi:hypothetical protein
MDVVGKTGSNDLFNADISCNCLYNNQTDFVGYPPGSYGTIVKQNHNGTPCDLAYNILTHLRQFEKLDT